MHRTIGAIFHDLLHGALHFEAKSWRTIPLLVLRPGRLTRRYIDGERARFVSPMALFLFTVFLMFAVFQVLGVGAEAGGPTATEIEQGLGPAGSSGAADDQLLTIEGAELLASNRTGITLVDKVIDKWRANPDLMLYKLQANSYKFSWLLIPLSVPFVWLLFAWKPQFKAYDHAIFVTYSLSFMTLLFVAMSLLGAVGISSDMLALISVIVPPLHLYKQLRGAYQLTRWSAMWRLVVLVACIGIVLLLFLQVLLLLGAV